MDDYSLASLNESKNEWCSRLLNVLTPHFIRGVQSVYDESVAICKTNREPNKYLMTFQNFLSRIPHWNNHIIENERDRILEASECPYLEDLITCIHVIQLKMLSCMRVSHENKKINMKLPVLDVFLHTVYINIAKKLYTNVYLFESTVEPMAKQRNNREVELLVRECIINTVRDNIPVAELLRIFMDESEEHDRETETRELTVLEKDGASDGGATTAGGDGERHGDGPEGREGDGDFGAGPNAALDIEPDDEHGIVVTKRGGDAGGDAGRIIPLKVADLDYPNADDAPSPKAGGGGITFSPFITQISQNGSESISGLDGYESDTDGPTGYGSPPADPPPTARDDSEPVRLTILEDDAPSRSHDDADWDLGIIPV